MGGFGNMQNLMRQAQKMQDDMMRAQEELASAQVEGVSGGGMVTVTMSGKKEILGIKLKREAVDPDDVEMLEDLIVAAINDASSKAQQLSDEKMGGFAGIGGLL
ncbi:MAG: YbaB/EbfC family nucleoid-associated protein [Clostridia bacterium]|nr:YbaB/EbfC family nucleoid-associated protein [Clostridia bacterium]